MRKCLQSFIKGCLILNMKSTHDQFTSNKFFNNFVLNQDMVECLINKSLIVQNGQWVSFNGKNHQIVGVSSHGIWLKRKGSFQFVTVESAHPHYGIDTNTPPPRPPAPFSNPLYDLVESINLPLLALAGGVALLLLTLIY